MRVNTGGLEKPVRCRELTDLLSVTGPGHGDSDFTQAPKCGTSPSGRRKVQVHLNFRVGLGNPRPVILVALWLQMDIFKAPFLSKFKKKRREIRARTGDNGDQRGFCPHLTISPSLRCLCYLICKSGWEF